MAQVFSGTMNSAYVDFSAMPDVCLTISAQSALVQMTQPVAPSSFPGNASISTIMQQIAGLMGKSLPERRRDGSTLECLLHRVSDRPDACRCSGGELLGNAERGKNGDAVEIWPKNTGQGRNGAADLARHWADGLPHIR